MYRLRVGFESDHKAFRIVTELLPAEVGFVLVQNWVSVKYNRHKRLTHHHSLIHFYILRSVFGQAERPQKLSFRS
jgi:hypothetical protein